MTSQNHDVTVLNSLITTTIDSANGFKEAAENVKNESFRSKFEQFAGERRQCVTSLQDAVRRMGGTPEDDGSLKAAAHRGWLDLKNAVSGDNDRKTIEEVERGEDYIKGKYETALKDDALSAEARRVVTESFGSVRQGHDWASQMKHSMEPAA